MSSPRHRYRVVLRDDMGHEVLKTLEEVLCAEGADLEDSGYDKRVLAAIGRGIDTEVALVEIVGGRRKDVRASLAMHLEAGHIAMDGDTYTIAKPRAGGRAKTESKAASKPQPKRASKAEPQVASKTQPKPSDKAKAKTKPKAEPKAKADPEPKDASKAKAASKPKAASKAKPRKPARKAESKKTLDSPEARAEFDAATLGAVEGGALTQSAIRKKLGGSALQVVGALGRLVDSGKLVISVEGPPARYKPASAANGQTKKTARQKLPVLKWSSASRNGRKGYTAPWDDGIFKIFPTRTGSFALFFQRGEAYEEYGCASSREVKKQAREIAAAGVPSAAKWHADGGRLGACPVAVRRTTKSKAATLTWTETVQDGRQVCVAPTVDGEFKMESTKGGSFALIFARDGDTSVDELGSGKKATLLKRALEIVDEEAREAAPDDELDDADDIDDTGDMGDTGDTDDTDDTGDDNTDGTDNDTADTSDDNTDGSSEPKQPKDQAASDAQLMAGLIKVLENL